jgi:hypothetical protein
MEKKIICILVCMLMCVSAISISVAKTTNEKPIKEIPRVDGLASGAISSFLSVQKLENKLLNIEQKFYAYNAYDSSGTVPEGPIYFYPSNPGDVTSIAPTSSTDFISGADFDEDGIWWATEFGYYGNDRLWKIDPDTGVMTLVGDEGIYPGDYLNGLCYDSTQDILYGCSGLSLYTVSYTGPATLVGSFNIPSGNSMIGIVCDNDGNMYGYTVSTSAISILYSINKNTGLATAIGSTGQQLCYAQDPSYDRDNKILYLAAYGPYGTGYGRLYTCDVSNGALTLIGNFENNMEVDGFAIPWTSNQPPLTPPAPNGPDQGITGISYTFNATTTDPEGDPIEYWFEWGDGQNSGWVSPGSAQHAWASAGTFDVTVKARDAVHGGESGFSPAHPIEILGGPILEIKNVKGRFFHVTAVIKNTGGTDATNVAWTIHLEGGAWIGKDSNGTIPSIPALGGQAEITSNFIMGFGKTKVTVTATIPESSDIVTRNGNVLLFYIIVRAGGG